MIRGLKVKGTPSEIKYKLKRFAHLTVSQTVKKLEVEWTIYNKLGV